MPGAFKFFGIEKKNFCGVFYRMNFLEKLKAGHIFKISSMSRYFNK
jgi:hypothetical protein